MTFEGEILRCILRMIFQGECFGNMSSMKDLNKNELIAVKNELQAKYDEYKAKNLSLNMARGIPSNEQLELSMGLLDAVNSSTDLTGINGADYRNYGILDGIPEAKQLFADLFNVTTDQIIVGGNSSLTLMFDTISSAMAHGLLGSTPWASLPEVKFLCPVPGYDRHFGITEYFGIKLIPVEMNEDGPDMDFIENAVANDDSIKGIWCVPKYSNPSGITYSDDVVRRFAALKPAAKDFRIFWDNAYCIHHLFNDDVKLLDILAECEKAGNPNMVYMYFSTSKITFPGAGMSGMASSKENIIAIKKRMIVQSIGPDKINQLRHMKFFKNLDGLLEQMKKHADVIRPKFEAVQKTLAEEFGDSGVAIWSNPNGGYFVSFNVMEGCAKRTVQLCKEAGVILTDAGATYPYGNDPKDSNIRIAPTSPSVEELTVAMRVLAVSAKLAAAEKLLG